MADSPNWLSVERREKMLEGHSLHCGVRALVASHAEADRREAELREQLAAKDAELQRERHVRETAEKEAIQHAERTAQLYIERDAKDAEIAAYRKTVAGHRNEIDSLSEHGYCLQQENERLRAALKAADLEHMNAVCDGAYYKPDETRMKIFRDGLREALVATTPAKEGK